MMTKAMTNLSFTIAAIIVVLIFFSSSTFPQLAFATVLYAALVYIGLMIFPRKSRHSARPAYVPVTETHHREYHEAHETPQENVMSLDIDKRAFIKLIGATSISFFLFSMLGRSVEGLLFGGKNTNSGFPPTQPLGGHDTQEPSSPTEGYRISEIDESEISYFGFTNKSGGWLIMKEDINSTAFRYAKGEKDFPKNWSNRESLTYDYYHNLI